MLNYYLALLMLASINVDLIYVTAELNLFLHAQLKINNFYCIRRSYITILEGISTILGDYYIADTVTRL